MPTLKPWVYGPFELLKHAEGHLQARTDFDKRMALISYDNTIETAITTYLQLHPEQRAGRTYPRDRVQQWLANYHSKLDFFDEHLRSLNLLAQVTRDEVIWYHDLRNELYHSGNGMVPEERNLQGARSAAIWIFSVLFEVDAEVLLKTEVPAPNPVRQQGTTQLSAQMRFLQSYIEFEKTLRATLMSMGISDQVRGSIGDVRNAWNLFSTQSEKHTRYNSILEEARRAREDVVHGRSIKLADQQLLDLASEIDQITKFVSRYGFSSDILPALKKRYPQWIRPEIQAARIIQKNQIVFLETTTRQGTLKDEKIIRTDLSFIVDDRIDRPYFPPTLTAQENAERFVNDFDPYSIMMCTDLFTPEGAEEVNRTFNPLLMRQRHEKA